MTVIMKTKKGNYDGLPLSEQLLMMCKEQLGNAEENVRHTKRKYLEAQAEFESLVAAYQIMQKSSHTNMLENSRNKGTTEEKP